MIDAAILLAVAFVCLGIGYGSGRRFNRDLIEAIKADNRILNDENESLMQDLEKEGGDLRIAQKPREPMNTWGTGQGDD